MCHVALGRAEQAVQEDQTALSQATASEGIAKLASDTARGWDQNQRCAGREGVREGHSYEYSWGCPRACVCVRQLLYKGATELPPSTSHA